MATIVFWKSWPTTYRYIGFVIALLFIFSLLFFCYAYWNYPSLPWNHIQELVKEEIPVHAFEHGLSELSIYADNYIIFEHLLGGIIPVHSTVSYVFLIILFVCMTVWLSIVTLLKRTWYYAGMGLFIFFTVSLHLEIFGIFGMDTKLFVATVLIAYVAISFYFQFFSNTTPFATRCFVFSLPTIVLAVLLLQFSNVDKPLLHVAANGLLAAFAISIVFVFTVAHEIIASFIYVVNQSSRQKKSLNHFLMISAVYMINLGLVYANRAGMITWNYIYINVFILLAVSAILGVWGMRQREIQYQNIIPADPFGVYFILCMASVCFVTIGYLFFTANDAPIVAVGDAIIYAHMGYGLMFILYVLSNFIGMLAKNLPVYKVLYRPNRMPYFTFQLAGFIATLAFVFYNNWKIPINNLLSARYQAEGDAYRSAGNIREAEAFYQQAGVYGFLNHRSNYIIAHLKGQQYNFFEEKKFYTRASRRRPTAFSYINLSQSFQREQDWLGAMLVLNRARKNLPNSAPIVNASGIVYSKLNVVDSALYLFSRAMEHDLTKNMATTNFIGVLVQHNMPVLPDSLLHSIEQGNVGSESNIVALANVQDRVLNMHLDSMKQSSLTVFDVALINNYLINRMLGHRTHRASIPDTAFVRKVVKLASNPLNTSFRESLSFICALAFYESGCVWEAIELLEEATTISDQRGRYNNVLALWAIEQHDPRGALIFLDYANSQHGEQAQVALAVALAESGNMGESLERWHVIQNQDSAYRLLAKKMVRVLTISPNRIALLTDEEKYMYCYYRIDVWNDILFGRTLLSIKNPDLRAKAIFDRAQKLFERDQIEASARMLSRVDGLQMHDRALYEQITSLEVAILARHRQLPMLAKRIEEIKQDHDREPLLQSEQLHYSALINEWSGDTVKAHAQYRLLAKYNPYDEESILAAARYFRKGEEGFASYNVLTEALHYNPYSVKLLKAYVLEAYRIGLVEYASGALKSLQKILTRKEIDDFLQKNKGMTPPIEG